MVLALMCVAGGLCALLVEMILQRARLHRDADAELRAQKAAEGALFRTHACLAGAWSGPPGAFDAALAACRPGSVQADGRTYAIFIERVGSGGPPYALRVRAQGGGYGEETQ